MSKTENSLKEVVFVLFKETSDENIFKMKIDVNEHFATIFFDADKKYLKHFNNVKNIFYKHCEADYLIVYTINDIIYKSLQEMYPDVVSVILANENELINYLNKGGERKNVL